MAGATISAPTSSGGNGKKGREKRSASANDNPDSWLEKVARPGADVNARAIISRGADGISRQLSGTDRLPESPDARRGWTGVPFDFSDTII